MNRIDIHSFNERLRLAEKLVEKRNPISVANSELIKKFEDYCFSEGLSKVRITKYVFTLRKIAEWLKKNLDLASK